MALSPSLDDFVARETYFDLMLVDTLLCSFDYAPDTLIKVARESSCNNGPAFIAAIMLEHECTVAFSHPYQSNFLPLNINGPPVYVGTSVADFHGASRITPPARWPACAGIAQKKPARSGPRLMHPLRRQRGPSQYRTLRSAGAKRKKKEIKKGRLVAGAARSR
jgi:hypothetical protein